MNENRYHGYTEGEETLTLVNEVVLEMQNSWRLINRPTRENPDEVSVLQFAGEGAETLNSRQDESIRDVFIL